AACSSAIRWSRVRPGEASITSGAPPPPFRSWGIRAPEGADHRTLHGQADGWLSRRAVRTPAPAAATPPRRQAPERVHGKPNQEPPRWISLASGTGERCTDWVVSGRVESTTFRPGQTSGRVLEPPKYR